jgi:signal transduction histidine kinase
LEDYSPLLDDVSKDYLQRARSGAQRMRQLINDLLKLSRVSGKGLNKEFIDLSQMVREIADGLRQSNPERNADITIDSDLTCFGTKD